MNQATDSRLILCDNPFNLKYYTMIFTKYSAGVDHKFEPGKDYYFIGRKNPLINPIFSIPFLARTSQSVVNIALDTVKTRPRDEASERGYATFIGSYDDGQLIASYINISVP